MIYFVKKTDIVMSRPISKVEVKGFEAMFYDAIMDTISLGKYRKFINDALSKIDVPNGGKLIDFGAGTGRNIEIIRKHLERKGVNNIDFFGVDIGEVMSKKFKQRAKKYNNIHFVKHDIRKPLSFEKSSFDTGLISFVLHGFIQEDRNKILSNFSHLIKPNGKLYILDYNEIDVNKAPFYVKFFFRKLECPLAEDFANKNLEEMLKPFGFQKVGESYYFKNIIRLAEYKKNSN